jgi:hypothetical protein
VIKKANFIVKSTTHLTLILHLHFIYQGRPDDGTDWCEFEDLPLETKCKLEGMKMMARWLVGLQSDAISAKKCFNMLNTVKKINI